jgi:urease gamma subunit
VEEVGTSPRILEMDNVQMSYKALVDELKDDEVVFCCEAINEKTFEVRPEKVVYRLSKGYFLIVDVCFYSLDEYSPAIREALKELSSSEHSTPVATMTLLHPYQSSVLENPAVVGRVIEIARKLKLPKNNTTPKIGMICMEDGDYYVKDFYIKKDYTIVEPDLHYGKGFIEFHEKLIERFKVDTKGLVLFHGDPGTGKTFYIRSLIGELVRMGRAVIYLPPNMVDHMVNPEMMSFISSTVLEQAENGKTCVLLLEDAEPLLVSRKVDGRSNGITNLLNVTDGLLNDMLSIQVIATFNTDLGNIDEALLRPERLIARKEFKKLAVEDAKTLGDKLGVEISKSSTLAEIYSKNHANEILVHEYESDRKKMGF